MLFLTRAHLVAINQHAETGYPDEVCGFLVGTCDGGAKNVTQIVPIANAHASPSERTRRFVVSTDDFYHTDKAARQTGQTILGTYHSHPDHPATPSETDRLHGWPWYSTVIVAVQSGHAVHCKAWVLRDDGSHFDPEPFTLTGD